MDYKFKYELDDLCTFVNQLHLTVGHQRESIKDLENKLKNQERILDLQQDSIKTHNEISKLQTQISQDLAARVSDLEDKMAWSTTSDDNIKLKPLKSTWDIPPVTSVTSNASETAAQAENKMHPKPGLDLDKVFRDSSKK